MYFNLVIENMPHLISHPTQQLPEINVRSIEEQTNMIGTDLLLVVITRSIGFAHKPEQSLRVGSTSSCSIWTD